MVYYTLMMILFLQFDVLPCEIIYLPKDPLSSLNREELFPTVGSSSKENYPLPSVDVDNSDSGIILKFHRNIPLDPAEADTQNTNSLDNTEFDPNAESFLSFEKRQKEKDTYENPTRSSEQENRPERREAADTSRHLRGDNFMRLGRQENLMRFGRDDKNLMRFGRSKENYQNTNNLTRFGRSEDRSILRFGKKDNGVAHFDMNNAGSLNELGNGFMRFGRTSKQQLKNFVDSNIFDNLHENSLNQLQKYDSAPIQFNRRDGSFMRFGKLDQNFMRFGKRNEIYLPSNYKRFGNILEYVLRGQKIPAIRYQYDSDDTSEPKPNDFTKFDSQ